MKKKSKIYVIEPWMRDQAHAPFNAGFIKIIQDVYPSHDILFHAERKHINRVNAKMNRPLESYKIHLFPLCNIYILPLFDLVSMIYPLFILFMKSKREDIIILTTRLPITHILFNLFNSIYKRKCFMPLHGEMETFINPKGIGFSRYYFYLNKLAFMLAGKWSNYVILGEPIKQKIEKRVSFVKSNIICIDHPIDENIENQITKLQNPIKIVFVGRAAKQKKAELLFYLAQKLQYEIENNILSIEIVGEVEDAVLKSSNQLVIYHIDKGYIDSSLYESKIASSHFFICFLDNKSYQAVPSGTFMDALKYEKPIIALRGNNFIDYYFSKYNDIGYLCDDIYKMKNILQTISCDLDSVKYENQVNNIKNAKREFFSTYIQNIFKSQLKNL